jgi:hypothetical protein
LTDQRDPLRNPRGFLVRIKNALSRTLSLNLLRKLDSSKSEVATNEQVVQPHSRKVGSHVVAVLRFCGFAVLGFGVESGGCSVVHDYCFAHGTVVLRVCGPASSHSSLKNPDSTPHKVDQSARDQPGSFIIIADQRPTVTRLQTLLPSMSAIPSHSILRSFLLACKARSADTWSKVVLIKYSLRSAILVPSLLIPVSR